MQAVGDRVMDERKWQPIETAPKDGTPILALDWLFHTNIPKPAIMYWGEDHRGGAWCDYASWEDPAEHTGWEYEMVSHWMPLPELPKNPFRGTIEK